MNELDYILAKIDGHIDPYIPLYLLCDMIGIKRATLTNQIRKKKFNVNFDGYKYHIHKDSAKEVAICNRGAILGWIRQKEIMEEFSVSSQILNYICKSRKLINEKDFRGHVRFPIETVLKLREILPSYLSKDITIRNGKTYYSITKLAHDMAGKVEKDCRIVRWKKEKTRIYKCIYKWCEGGYIPYIRVSGKTHIYLPDFVYDDLIDKIRIVDAARLCGVSKRTIYNWIQKEVLPTTTSPSGSTLINLTDLDNALILKTQIELMKKNISDISKVNDISEFQSKFWRSEIRALKDLGGAFKKDKNSGNNVDRDKFIEKVKGWDKTRIRVVRAVGKRKGKSDLASLDATIYSQEDVSLLDKLEDISVPSPSESVESEDLMMLFNTLNDDDREIIKRTFGMDGHDAITISELAMDRKESVTDLQNRIDNILNDLKMKF